MSLLSDAEVLQGWRSRLRQRLREASEPIFASGPDLCPAASIWVMVRHEVERLRQQATHCAPLPATASVAGLATILAALWLDINLHIDPDSPASDGFIPPGNGPAVVSTQDLLAAPSLGLPSAVTIASDWGTGRVLAEHLLPAIFSAEIICLGPCQPEVLEALQG